MGSRINEERLDRLVNAQRGCITRAQLHELGYTDRTIQGWIKTRRLHRALPRVYAVGHTAPNREAALWAAVLYAGPGAMLSHATAAHWRGLIIYPPPMIEVSSPRQRKSIRAIKVYNRRVHTRQFYKRLPMTSIPQTLLDLAATSELQVVRRALSVLDYEDLLELRALEAVCKHGRPGSTRLRQALNKHQPEIARTNGRFELRFLLWCERWKVPIPEFNRWIHGIQVDAHWPNTNLVVELDGGNNHRSKAQLHNDMVNDLTLRRHGVTVHRYEWTQLRIQAREIRDEILAHLRTKC